jgi:hypothetical protein
VGVESARGLAQVDTLRRGQEREAAFDTLGKIFTPAGAQVYSPRRRSAGPSPFLPGSTAIFAAWRHGRCRAKPWPSFCIAMNVAAQTTFDPPAAARQALGPWIPEILRLVRDGIVPASRKVTPPHPSPPSY